MKIHVILSLVILITITCSLSGCVEKERPVEWVTVGDFILQVGENITVDNVTIGFAFIENERIWDSPRATIIVDGNRMIIKRGYTYPLSGNHTILLDDSMSSYGRFILKRAEEES